MGSLRPKVGSQVLRGLHTQSLAHPLVTATTCKKNINAISRQPPIVPHRKELLFNFYPNVTELGSLLADNLALFACVQYGHCGLQKPTW